MDIKKIDKNFDTTFIPPEDIEWFSIQELPFEMRGIFYAKEEGLYRRMPKAIADATNEGVAHLSKHTAGQGQETYLWFEENRWFVEAKQ